MRHQQLWLCLLLLSFGLGTAWAGTCVLSGADGFALQVTSTAPLMKTPQGAVVQGSITMSPAAALTAGLGSTYFLDEKPLAVSFDLRPELTVDTTKLSDGTHAVRLEVHDGTRLAFSSGNLPLHVANDTTTNVILKQAQTSAPAFVKLYRKVLLREIVFFDKREADLEKHGFLSHGRIYITLTDLMRHVGGNMVWGPTAGYLTVERNGVKVRVVPGSSRVYVNGEKQSLGRAAYRIDNRTFVPIRPMLDIFGLDTDWNRPLHRAFVNTK
jgi:hypothetical protein